MDDDQTKFYVGLSLLPGVGPSRLTRLVETFRSARAAWEASPSALRSAGLDEKTVQAVLEKRRDTDLVREIQRVQEFGARVITWDSPDYPALLRETFNRPALLYVIGSLTPAEDLSVAIVGTRRPTMYGRALATRVTPALVEHGLTTVSGLALGIDTIAHKAALEVGGRTIAVLGSGLDVLYPSANRGLARRIVENGAIITEYPMGTQPDAFNFPARNRIISGLSLGTLIVEAGERSGALLTANYALEQNREVFAFPGRITDDMSLGCNRLIKDGRAKLVATPEDILDELNLASMQGQLRLPDPPRQGDTPTERLILGTLGTAPMHIDELGRQAGLPAGEVTGAITMLELKGIVRNVGGMHYVLST